MIHLMKKQLLWMSIVLFVILNIVLVIEQQRTAIFKIPIVIEDRDHTESSKKWIEAIKESSAIQVKMVEGDFLSAEDFVRNNDASIAIIIPTGFEHKLTENDTKKSVELYQANGLVAAIATETISEALYEQQIPFIIYKYTKNKAELVNVQKIYDENEPEYQLKKEVVLGNAERGNIQTLLMIVSAMLALLSQVFLFKNLRQFHTLRRIKIYEYSQWTLMLKYFIHILVLTVLLTSVISLLWGLPIVLFQTLIWISMYQIVATLIIFKIRTTSHALFMLGAWSISLCILYILSQLIGGIG